MAARGIVTPRSKRRYRGVPQRPRGAESQLAAKGEPRTASARIALDTQADGTLPGHACPNDVSAATPSESRDSETDRSASRIPTGTRRAVVVCRFHIDVPGSLPLRRRLLGSFRSARARDAPARRGEQPKAVLGGQGPPKPDGSCPPPSRLGWNRVEPDTRIIESAGPKPSVAPGGPPGRVAYSYAGVARAETRQRNPLSATACQRRDRIAGSLSPPGAEQSSASRGTEPRSLACRVMRPRPKSPE